MSRWSTEDFLSGVETILYTLMMDYKHVGTSLTNQWLRFCLPMQGVHVDPLSESWDPTCLVGQKTKT